MKFEWADRHIADRNQKENKGCKVLGHARLPGLALDGAVNWCLPSLLMIGSETPYRLAPGSGPEC